MKLDVIRDPHGTTPPITTALLLAAGLGSRLSAATSGAPKCLTQVNGTSILEQQVSCLERCGFKRLIVVVGHEAEQIKTALLRYTGNLDVEYVTNAQYRTTNNVYSLWLAREAVREPLLLLESDLYFEPHLLAGMLHPDKIAVARLQPWMQGTTVTLDASRHVAAFQLGGTARYTPSAYKTVNIYALSSSTWRQVTIRLESYISSGRVNDYYEALFKDMVADGDLDLQAVSFDDGRWYEIDTVEDLRAAKALFSRHGTSPAPSTSLNRVRDDSAAPHG